MQVAHEEAIPRLAEHLQPLFDASPDAVYIWLDEEHWTGNEKLASLLGATVDELANTPGFLQRFVHEDDQSMFSWTYWNRVQALSFPAHFRFRAVRVDGEVLPMEVDMIPLTYGGHTVALHFMRATSA
jgi:PAS domain S-box-containing protein